MIKRQSIGMIALLSVSIVGCAGSGSNQYQEPPPQKVYVSRPVRRDVIDFVEATGTTEPFETVEIRARVEGYLEEIKFEPGQQNMKAGDELYVIDQKPYLVKAAQAKAAVKIAEAQAKDAEAKYRRAVPLARDNAVSQEELQERQAAVDAAKASVAAAEAQLEGALLDLNFTVVKTPIAGRVGKTLVDKGNLVRGSMQQPLTTVIRYDPIFATFNISERLLLELLSMRDKERAKKGAGDREQPIKFLMGLSNEEGYPHEGNLNYTDLAVDASSGTFEVRGEFANPDLSIVPGLFVRIRIPVGERKDALLIPEKRHGGRPGRPLRSGGNRIGRHAGS